MAPPAFAAARRAAAPCCCCAPCCGPVLLLLRRAEAEAEAPCCCCGAVLRLRPRAAAAAHRAAAPCCCCAGRAAVDRYFLPPFPQQQTRLALLQWANRTDRRADTVPLLRPCFVYYADSASGPVSHVLVECRTLLRRHRLRHWMTSRRPAVTRAGWALRRRCGLVTTR